MPNFHIIITWNILALSEISPREFHPFHVVDETQHALLDLNFFGMYCTQLRTISAGSTFSEQPFTWLTQALTPCQSQGRVVGSQKKYRGPSHLCCLEVDTGHPLLVTQTPLFWTLSNDTKACCCHPGLFGHGHPLGKQGQVGLNGLSGGPRESAGCLGSEPLPHSKGTIMCAAIRLFSASWCKPFVSQDGLCALEALEG